MQRLTRILRRVFLFSGLIGASAALQGAGRSLTIVAAEGGKPIQVTVDGARVKITAGSDSLLTGETKDGQKRRYLDKAGRPLAEVRFGETDGFKVRTPANKLLWKVRVADDKTKVSDNEENKGAYELVRKGAMVRVVKDERLLGSFPFGPPTVTGPTAPNTVVKGPSGEDRFHTQPPLRSVAPGVLLMSAIPLEHRYIIIAELLARSP